MTTIPDYTGCPWPIDPGLPRRRLGPLDPRCRTGRWRSPAATLRRLTGYRVGGCPVTVRPCTQTLHDASVPLLRRRLRAVASPPGSTPPGTGSTPAAAHRLLLHALCEVVLARARSVRSSR